MAQETTGQLDLLDLVADTEPCPVCRCPRSLHYPQTAGTQGCRVFTCPCRGWPWRSPE